MTPSGCTKTPEELLTGVKLSFGRLQIFARKVFPRVPEKMRKAWDAKARSGFLLQFLSYGRICSLFEDDWDVKTTRHCLVGDYVFPTKQCQNVFWVSSNELEDSLLNDCDGAAVDDVGDGHGPPLLDLTIEIVAQERDDGCRDLGV